MNHKAVKMEKMRKLQTNEVAIALQFEISLVSRLLGDTDEHLYLYGGLINALLGIKGAKAIK